MENRKHGNAPTKPDEIYPVHFIDQASIIRSSLISYTFRYDQGLDAVKLCDSLMILLESKEWRKLGGRLRTNKDGKLEIHVPIHFSPNRPPLRFSHVELGVRMDAHSLASRLPKKTGKRPSLHEGCRAFREFSIPATLPNNIEHYLSTDEPLICLHITTFTDGTLVSLTFPHSLSDAMGTSALVKAWARVLQSEGHGSLEIHPVGAKHDIIAPFGTPDDKIARDTEFSLERQQTKYLSLLLFAARVAWDNLTRRNIETRHIYLPSNFISHLRMQASQDRTTEFISDGDLIAAWGSRMVLSSAPSRGSAVIYNIFDIRGRLNLHKSPTAVFLQNLILPSTTILTVDEAASLSVSQLAHRVRKAIVEQTSVAQVRSLIRITRSWFTRLSGMPLFARWDTKRVIAITNWTKARLLEQADFAPAVDTAQTVDDEKSLKPIGFWGTTLSVSDNPRDTFVVYGKDHDGNYWVHGYLRTETWHLIQEEFNTFVSASSK
ncbi:hypothetical protein F5Y03DRAFT_406398 [Xylaria venustula]|nr:hypothetical protein F5Y03DRAFT_406398 [Xylaria venustula]